MLSTACLFKYKGCRRVASSGNNTTTTCRHLRCPYIVVEALTTSLCASHTWSTQVFALFVAFFKHCCRDTTTPSRFSCRCHSRSFDASPIYFFDFIQYNLVSSVVHSSLSTLFTLTTAGCIVTLSFFCTSQLSWRPSASTFRHLRMVRALCLVLSILAASVCVFVPDVFLGLANLAHAWP